MSTSKRQWLRVAGRVLVAVLLGVLVLNFIAVVAMDSDLLPTAIRSQPWAEGFLIHTTMWFISLILILIISKGRFSTYGFCRGESYRIAQMITLGMITGIAFAIVLQMLPEGTDTLEKDDSFAQTVVFVWLYASISEEILTRGLIQGFLSPLMRYGFSVSGVRISLPVLTSAFFFGLMHLAVLTTGVAVFPVVWYVVFASALGLIAGYHREQTGSIVPAIIVHMFGNIGGYCTGLLIG